jgi:hypothetical protein
MRETKKVNKFLAAMEAHITNHKVEDRLAAANTLISNGYLPLSKFTPIYEGIVGDVDQAIRNGPAAARRHNVGYTRSSALAETTVSVWYLVLEDTAFSKQEYHCHVPGKTNLCNQGISPYCSILYPRSHNFRHLHDAWGDSRDVQRRADEAHHEWLNEEADTVTTSSQNDQETALHQISK